MLVFSVRGFVLVLGTLTLTLILKLTLRPNPIPKALLYWNLVICQNCVPDLAKFWGLKHYL